MNTIKQRLSPLVWLKVKSNHTASSPATKPSTSTAKATRRPKKRALLIGIAADPSPEPVDGVSRRQEATVESPLPVTPGRDSLSLIRLETGTKKRGSTNTGVKKVTKSGSFALIKKKLPTAHNDVAMMKKALTKWYGYKPKDITILIDDNKPGKKQPTRDNILTEIDCLVDGIEAGDTLFFHFAGHGTQEDTIDIEEEDRKNEVMLTSDGLRIVDNELHAHLIQPLPPGSTLVAVCDACHSGSLLDLPHSKCNAVFVPWQNKGERGSRDKQNKTTRRLARMFTINPLNTRLRGLGWGTTSTFAIRKPTAKKSNTTQEVFSADHVLSESPKIMHAMPGMAITKDPQSHSQTHSHSQVHAQSSGNGEDILPHGRYSLSKQYDALSSSRVTPRASTSTSTSNPRGAHSSSLPHGRSSLSKEYEEHPRGNPLAATSTSTSQSYVHFTRSSHPASGSSHHAQVTHPHPQRTPPAPHKLISSKGLSIKTNASLLSRASHTKAPYNGEGNDNIVESPYTMYCTGCCELNAENGGQKMSLVGPRDRGVDVICLSSSMDSQKTWNDTKGRTMTYQLYKILKKDHHPTLPSLLNSLSHSLHTSYLALHTASQAHKDKLHRKQEEQRLEALKGKKQSINSGKGVEEQKVEVGEMNNFQVPVLSSFVPLPKDKVWNP